MKEYENKSLEELRFEDYSANRKGPSAGSMLGNAGGSGLFGATIQQGTSGLFSAPQNQTSGLFGQQSKPMFGAATTSAFGMSTASPFSTSTSAFGATSTTGSSGMFGAKPMGFGTSTTTTGAFGGFGQTTNAGGGLFGQPKPFGTATSQSSGSLFSTTTSAFGATPAFGAPAAPTGFGQAPPNQQIGLFGQPAAKPTGFGTAFGAPTSSAAPSFGFGTTTNTQANPFGQQNKPAFSFGGPTSSVPAFGAPAGAPAFGAPQPQQGGLFSAASKPAFGFGAATSQPSTFGASTGFNSTGGLSSGGLFGSQQPKPGGLFGGSTGFGATSTMQPSTGFGAPSGKLYFCPNSNKMKCS